ncbi:MAG: inositol monophosphatase family protein [Planctomycetota bacterium]
MTTGAYLKSAEQIVRGAGDIARRGFGRSPVVRLKPAGEPVTEADLQVERHILGTLREQYPNHGFLSEEAGQVGDDCEYRWILDPIDGTKYYARGIPLYSISLALERRGEPIVGVVFNPETGQMFCGANDRDARLNDVEIRCSQAKRLEETTICLEIPSRDSPASQRKWAMEKMGTLVDHVGRVRMLGVGALGLCFAAAGAFDAYLNLGSGSQHYDIAAGRIIVSAAGGQFVPVGERIVAGPAVLCEQLLDLLGLAAR